MDRSAITPDRFYQCAIARAGRGGRRIVDTDIVQVLRVERDPWYTNSVRYRVIVLRALMKGIVRLALEPRDVLRPATPEETARYEGHFALVREHGWVDQTLDENAPDYNPPQSTDSNPGD